MTQVTQVTRAADLINLHAFRKHNQVSQSPIN